MSIARRTLKQVRGISVLTAVTLVFGCAQDPEFEPLTFPGASGSAQPRLTSDVDGTPIMSWLEPDGADTVLKYARLERAGFSEPREVVRSDRMFINWADFPSVTPITDQLWFAHWLKRQPDSFTYDVATAISQDGGMSWAAAEQMNEDETKAEHGFVSVFPWDSQVAAFWLDGRELADWSIDDPEALLGVSLRLASYDDAGSVTRRRVVDELVCDCCQPDVAMTETGPIVIYRDRTENEIRDVVVRRYLGDDWSDVVNLGNENWFIEGCPVNGPVIAARGSDVVAAWFTAADDNSRLRFARSSDAGLSFQAAIDVDTRGTLGQPAIVLDDDGRALLSWWRRGALGGIDLMVRGYDRDGTAGQDHLIAHEAIGQAIDVPQMIAVGEGYLIAWTTLDGEGNVRLSGSDLKL